MLHGFELAELVEPCRVTACTKVVGIVNRNEIAERLDELFNTHEQISHKFVGDLLALKILLRRQKPEVLLVEIGSEDEQTQLQQLFEDPANGLNDVRLVILPNNEDTPFELAANISPDFVWHSTSGDQQLVEAILASEVESNCDDDASVESEETPDLQPATDEAVEQY